MVGEPGGVEGALSALDSLRTGDSIRIPNRAGFSASLGNAGWAGLEPGCRYLFTLEAVRRLIAHRDQVVHRSRWVPAASVVAMWQTLLNGLTFGRNVALAALGQSAPLAAEHRWQRMIDALITVAAAVPALVVALPIELLGAALGRGSVLALRTELL